VIQGDAQSLESIASALQGQQIVVSTLGGQDLASNTQNLIEAMTNAGVKRLAVTLSIGLLLPSVEPRFAAISAQHRRILEALQAGELEWIAACPPGITDQPRTGQYLATPGRPPGNWTISRYDLADFLLQAALSEKFLRQAVGISN
jgi:putative NADH-flavin reductase